jgi:CBS domain containing-hemolysin-like protein
VQVLNVYNFPVDIVVLPSSNLIERWVFVVVTLLGFVVMDMAYAAVVINYSIQCQLLVFLFCSICERIRAKDWDIERTIKV